MSNQLISICIYAKRYPITLCCLFCAYSIAHAQDSTRTREILLTGSLSWSVNKVEYWNNSEQRLDSEVLNSLVLSGGFTIKGNYRFMGFLYYNFNRDLVDKLPWLTDYAVMIVRDSYMPDSWFWGYSSFASNRFSNTLSEMGEALSTGTLYAGYRFKTPKKLVNAIRLDSTTIIRTDLQIAYQPKYYDRSGELVGGLFDGKPIALLNLQYVVYKGIFLTLSVRYHLRNEIKMPWESDYAYGFGISNGQLGFINFKAWQFTFTYTNANNKFPWSEEKLNKGFFDGNFMISYNYKFMYWKKKRH